MLLLGLDGVAAVGLGVTPPARRLVVGRRELGVPESQLEVVRVELGVAVAALRDLVVMLDLDRPVLLVLNVRLLVRAVLVRDPFLLALEFVLGGERNSRARDLPPPPDVRSRPGWIFQQMYTSSVTIVELVSGM